MNQEARPNQPEATASGFDTRQIASEDLAALHALFAPCRLEGFGEEALELRSVAPADSGPHSVVTQSIALDLRPTRSLKLRIEPLPQRATLRHTRFNPLKAGLRRGLGPALRIPISRRRLGVGELSDGRGEAILRAVFKKYGEEAHQLHLEGVYAEIPAELAGNVRFTADRRTALITVPPGFNAAKAGAGCYLVELATPDGATRRTIFRL